MGQKFRFSATSRRKVKIEIFDDLIIHILFTFKIDERERNAIQHPLVMDIL